VFGEKYKFDISESTKEKNEFKKLLRKQLKKVKNDLLNNTLHSDEQYHDWINTNRHKLVPKELNKSVHYDLVCSPQKYIKHLIFINKNLEILQCKQINVFPLKRRLVPSYITLDTACLLELLYDKGTKVLRDNLCENKELIWSSWFNLDHKCFKMSKSSKYKFDHTISTDGVGVSIRFSSDNNIHKKSKKDKTKRSVKVYKDKNEEIPSEFKYVTEIVDDELKDMKEKNRVYVDPNLGNIIYALDEKNNKIFRYTRAQRRHETGRTKHGKIINKIKKENNLNVLEDKIGEMNSKSCDYESFRKYIEIKNNCAQEGLSQTYEEKIFRKLKIREKINTQSSESKLLNNLERIYGKDSIFCIGDCNENQQLKGTAPTPHIGIKRLIKRKFKVYYVDEYRTSILNWRTEMRQENAYVKQGNETKKLHAVLVSKTSPNNIGATSFIQPERFRRTHS
jgi:hypothetical protein